MKTTKTLLIMFVLGGCASGDGDDGDGAETGTASIGTDTTAAMTEGMTTMETMTTAPTTASTLTATTADPDSSSTDPTDATTGTDTTGGEDVTCDAYCGMYLSACADFSEYANEQDCLDNCAQWPVGAAADTAVDSLGCRLYHATVASSTDPALHCTHAGPSGAATCVAADAPECDLYCTRYFTNCTEDLNAYVDMADCLDQCSTWYPGADADVDGHTIGCHSYHANAAVGGPEKHCPHASPGGGGICVL